MDNVTTYSPLLDAFMSSPDFKTSRLAGLLRRIDAMDVVYVDKISDEIFRAQPFFLTVMLGHRHDMTMDELDEIVRIYFLIWGYFKDDKNVRQTPITEAQFDKVQLRHFQMLKYVEGEACKDTIKEIQEREFLACRSLDLVAVIYHRFQTRPLLSGLPLEYQGIALIGMQSFIECFEVIRG